MPLLRQGLYEQNVNIFLAPTAHATEIWVPLMQTIGSEGRTFVLTATPCVKSSDLPNWITEASKGKEGDSDDVVSRGGTTIVAPTGEILAGPAWDEDDRILLVDADMDDCVRGRLDLDVAGSYARRDAFELVVDGLDLSPPV
jgi:nitrilase